MGRRSAFVVVVFVFFVVVVFAYNLFLADIALFRADARPFFWSPYAVVPGCSKVFAIGFALCRLKVSIASLIYSI